METIALPNGRVLEYLLDGPADGPALLVHHGTPGGAVRIPPVFAAAARHGLRTILAGRPGYGASTPRPERGIADVAPDVEILLDALGVDDFLTLGWSGGGPHALACAALLPQRCRGVALLAGVAPHDGQGLDFSAGMCADNVAEFGFAAEGRAALEPLLIQAAPAMATVTAEALTASPSDVFCDADRRAMADGLDSFMIEVASHGVSSGIAGWRDDDLAFVSGWGFELERVTCPVAVWHGTDDLMVPVGHGRWLGDHLTHAEVHVRPGHGHVSLLNESEAILAWLIGAAGAPPERTGSVG
ncbi:alpha/beta fold hydrolase [Microlunatus ginsengisoli]|uniref:Alpha/beta hydrolase n=1 Tax=Microlunatus ginsengisoli TaxID=363863 RepID=A0ABP7ARN1_9ACTN